MTWEATGPNSSKAGTNHQRHPTAGDADGQMADKPVLVDTCSLCPPGSATEGCPERLAPSKTLSGGAACGCPAATISCYDPLSSSETEACPESPGPSLGRTLRGSHLQFVASRPHLEGIGGCSKHLLGENVVVSGEAAVTNIHAMHCLHSSGKSELPPSDSHQ